MSITPPRSEQELLSRAHALSGMSFGELTRGLEVTLPAQPARAKGFVGQLIEHALGASAGNKRHPDFESIGVELKTIPLSLDGRAIESTFVCGASFSDMIYSDYEASHVARKLERVLWMPIEGDTHKEFYNRRVGLGFLWSPSLEQREMLRNDWEMLATLIGAGHIADIDGSMGEALQLRPKAADARVRRIAPAADGGTALDSPKGFYLRASFTTEIVRLATQSVVQVMQKSLVPTR